MRMTVPVTAGRDPTGSVASLIRSARDAAGLTQAALAERLHTRQSVVSRWESGRDEPRLSTLARIMSACGLSLSLVVEPEGVDRAQLREQLAMTPSERLASVRNLSRTLAGARRVG
ncbi:MAG: helix-turn-helix transcriptional regulator [Acidimicrobiia bacterium]